MDGQRDDHPLAARASLVTARAAGRENARAAGVEETPRLFAGAVEDLGRVERRRDGPDGVDQRLEEGRLGLELVLGRLVPAPLRDDQVERKGPEERGRGHQAPGGDLSLAEREAERADERGANRAGDQDRPRPPS